MNKVSQTFAKSPVFFFTLSIILGMLHPLSISALDKGFTNTAGMEFILIPAGSFSMGSPPDEPHRNKDETRHRVTIGRPFLMQTTEVTVGQWRAVMGKRFFGRKKGTNEMPVVKVSWHDCMKFIEKLNKRGEGVYRLPTEAEWEYACRAGSIAAYAWGDAVDCSKAMYANNTLETDDCVKYTESKGLPSDQPSPKKSYKPNAWGLYDMEGNVWEWCRDWHGPFGSDAVIDPQGPESGSDRVRRGGSWYGPGHRCRCANRNFSHPSSRYRTTGFRLVREAE